MTGRRGRSGTRRRGWLHRRHHRRSAAQPTETADVAGSDHGDAADGTGDTHDTPEADPQASLDQVLRRAAEARDAERDPDD